MPQKKASGKRKDSYNSYRNGNRRLMHKVNKLARRFKHYKKQPPDILNGMPKDLAELIRKKLKKLRKEYA